MQLNGGKIKETQVSLLLSSRAEMQKVIEKARQATTFMSKISAQQSSVLPAAVIANQFAKKMPEPAMPQPPVISLTSFLSQSMQQQTPQQLNLLSAYQTMPPNELPGMSGAPSALGIPQAAAAAYANYYATLMDPNSLNFVKSMSGLAAKPAEVPPTYNKDPRSRRSNSRERNSYRRQRSRSAERKPSRRSRSGSRDRYTDSDKEGKDSSRRRSRFSTADVPNMAALPPSMNNNPAVGYSVPPPSTNPIWERPPPQLFGNEKNSPLRSVNSYAGFNNGNSSLPPTRHYQTESKASSTTSSSLGNIGTCVKVSNVDNETFYSDLRKFFTGLPIGNNDIKFVVDAKGNRTGIVLVRFVTSDSKKKALTKSLWQLKSTQVVITSITEEDFESGLMNSKNRPGGNNFRNNDRHESRNERFRDRSDSREREREHHNRNFNRNDGNNRNNNNNRYDERPQNNNNREQGGGNFRRDNNERNFRSFKSEEPQEKPKEYQPDENFTVLIIDDIPRTANEPDICEAFPNIVSISIDRYTAYVKFSSHEAAKVTLENRFIHYIRNKRVFLEAGSMAQFNDVSRKFGKFDNPEAEVNGDDSKGGNFISDQVNDDTNHSNNSNSRDSSRNREQKPFESRDPRQRNFTNERFAGNGQQQNNNQMKTDCVIMKNMEPNTTIEDVEHFYKDLGIFKMRVHILLDKKGLLGIYFFVGTIDGSAFLLEVPALNHRWFVYVLKDICECF